MDPDAGTTDTWSIEFDHMEAPQGTKLVMLHFIDADIPAGNRLEVQLGYDTDVFTSGSGTDFWTRPANVAALPNKKVPAKYISATGTGGVTIDKYGRGERHSKAPDPDHSDPGYDSFSNCDPFFTTGSYQEPDYAKFWICGGGDPNWENVAKIDPDDDIRKVVARSVGMVVMLYTVLDVEYLSTCSVTLVAPDTVILAGHCIEDLVEETKSASVTFDYQLDAFDAVPASYNARFYKVTNLLHHEHEHVVGGLDYCLLQLALPPGGLGIPPIQMRHDIPGPGEKVFGVHHPNGAVKKLSIPHPSFEVVASAGSFIRTNLDVAGGSSGSGLFDEVGRIVGVLSNGVACDLRYCPTSLILNDIAVPPTAPPITRDVMMVFDRSGSMGLVGALGRRKIDEARDAASLFVQLIRSDNRVGLDSFSTQATKSPVDSPISPVDSVRPSLIGGPPFSGGIVGMLNPGGTTSIGDGLKTGSAEFGTGSNPRSILLFTDGLQNTAPMIEDADVQAALIGIDVHAIGYGTEASLNGDLLNALALDHSGLYVRADTSLQLEKFFANAFGNIFESGLMIDPEYVLPRGQRAGWAVPFTVCGEERITIVVGWENPEAALYIEATTPGGASIAGGSPGVEQSSGRTWTFLRIPLPHGGERDGAWSAQVLRLEGRGEFAAPAPETRYFINVIAAGGPRLRRIRTGRRYYTGDTINPLAILRYADGSAPRNARARVTIKRPARSVGNILTRAKLKPPITIDGDTIPARQASLIELERSAGRPLVGYSEVTFDMFSNPQNTNGMFRAAGIFGNVLKNLLTVEGNYTFHVVASYGKGCVSTREAQWSVHVNPSIDPSRTGVTVAQTGTRADGTVTGTITVTPRDPYGNNVGPGRGGDMSFSGTQGTTVTGPVKDNGDGSYTVPVAWVPAGGTPGVVIGQPDRPPVVVGPTRPGGKTCKYCWLFAGLLLLVLIGLLLEWLLEK
jgi:Trypsin-like peptidase domain/von Willebrand factor type A domain